MSNPDADEMECPVPDCDTMKPTRKKIIWHMRNDHGIELDRAHGGNLRTNRMVQAKQFAEWLELNEYDEPFDVSFFTDVQHFLGTITEDEWKNVQLEDAGRQSVTGSGDAGGEGEDEDEDDGYAAGGGSRAEVDEDEANEIGDDQDGVDFDQLGKNCARAERDITTTLKGGTVAFKDRVTDEEIPWTFKLSEIASDICDDEDRAIGRWAKFHRTVDWDKVDQDTLDALAYFVRDQLIVWVRWYQKSGRLHFVDRLIEEMKLIFKLHKPGFVVEDTY